MRTKNTIKNALVGTSMQLISMIFSFLTRAVFARVLTVEYLGLESVFADIINMLSIAEMGFSTAITYSLYTPIRENNFDKINSLVKLYKKVYETIGLLILLAGGILTPFLPSLIKNIPTVSENIYFLFLLFLINSVISYFFSYKQTLIIANQKDYLVQKTTKLFTIASNILQIVILVIFQDFILYYVIKIITVLITNVYLSKKADILFPFLDLTNVNPLEKKELSTIKKNIGAMFFHKIGYRIVFSTDNLFISYFSSVSNAGKYSNYDLISRSLALLLDMVLNASIASVGNLNAENNRRKSESVFQHIFFLNFILYSFSSSILFSILNDFITIWMGIEYQLSFLSVILIVINFYIHGMRRTVIIFRDTWGLFYKDRYKPILEIIINISVQLVLGKLYGLNGILFGTTLSILLSSFWIEPLVLYKYGFEMSLSKFFKPYFNYLFKMLIFIGVSFYITSFIEFEGFFSFLLKTTVSIITTLISMVILLHKENSFVYYLTLMKNMVKYSRKE